MSSRASAACRAIVLLLDLLLDRSPGLLGDAQPTPFIVPESGAPLQITDPPAALDDLPVVRSREARADLLEPSPRPAGVLEAPAIRVQRGQQALGRSRLLAHLAEEVVLDLQLLLRGGDRLGRPVLFPVRASFGRITVPIPEPFLGLRIAQDGLGRGRRLGPCRRRVRAQVDEEEDAEQPRRQPAAAARPPGTSAPGARKLPRDHGSPRPRIVDRLHPDSRQDRATAIARLAVREATPVGL
jgi:hypothetical protein